MPRTKGSLNKKTLLLRERQEKSPFLRGAKTQPTPEAPAEPGERQFDSLTELRKIARIQLGMAAREQRRLAAIANALEEGASPPSENPLREMLRDARVTLKDIAPYEHPQKRALTIAPEPLDLSRLTNEQLALFTQLYALATGAAGDASDGAAATLQ